MIFDVRQFFARVDAALSALRLPYERRLVEYVSSDHDGELGVFRKRADFEYQAELRFAVHGCSTDTLKLSAGSSEDVSMPRRSGRCHRAKCISRMPSQSSPVIVTGAVGASSSASL